MTPLNKSMGANDNNVSNVKDNIGVDISISCLSWQDALPDIEEICRKAVTTAVLSVLKLSSKAIPPIEVSLVLSDDNFIQGLNSQYRQIDRPTNVLAFPGDDLADCLTPHSTSVPALLGDVVVAYESAASEAHDENKSLADHLSHLVVHGTLHLLGYDHENEDDAAVMEALEIKVLGSLDVQNPYDEK